ncbi:MAG: hypothetical protein GY775_11505 [Candidatus Scalindua sp.]|nr:hypothetical protein [Candidatus Scalindua sp.]
MKSDVKSYYASIDHDILLSLLQEYVPDRLVQRLLWQYMRRTAYCDGLYSDVKRGISLGCPLSPLMGALYLKQLDDMMEKTGLYYARFMDDWIVIAPTRWKLRSAVRIVNATLNALKVEQHPDKTFIGKVERGFDFLEYFLKPGILGVSRGTFERFTERISRLYEQGADYLRIGVYVKHWLKWVKTGLSIKDWVGSGTDNRKRQYSPLNGEYWRLCYDSNFVKSYSAIINCFLLPSTSCFCTCKSD